MDIRFFEKVVLITGSSQGIGRETAYALLMEGAMVVINGRDYGRLERTQFELLARLERSGDYAKNMRQLEHKGKKVKQLEESLSICEGDTSDESDAQRIVAHTISKFGKLDYLINNAGISMRGNFRDTTVDVWQKIISNNLLNAVIMTKAALPELKRQKGSILYVSSVGAIIGFAGVIPYSAAKMGLLALQQGLQVEEPRLHVGIIYIGFTRNDEKKQILSATGNLIQSKRQHVLTQQDVAKKILKAIHRRRSTTILTFSGRLLSIMNRFFPFLLRRWAFAKKGSTHSV